MLSLLSLKSCLPVAPFLPKNVLRSSSFLRRTTSQLTRLPMSSSSSDWILVNNLSVRTTAGQSLWEKPGVHLKPQPLLVSVAVPYSIKLAGASDELPYSIHYGNLAKTITKTCEQSKAPFACVEDVAEGIARAAFAAFPVMHAISVTVEKPRALLHAKSVSVKMSRHRDPQTSDDSLDHILVHDLELSTIIGIHPWERENKQRVKINLDVCVPSHRPSSTEGFDYAQLVGRVSSHVLQSAYQTIEALVTAVAQEALLSSEQVKGVTARVGKPSALMWAESPEIQVTRTRDDLLDSSSSSSATHPEPNSEHFAAIAFGSNIGDRFLHIERALRQLEQSRAAKILDTGFLYESKAMYVTEQRDFINGACLVSTQLGPEELLGLLKKVEEDIGRTPTVRNGPRVVDLDLIFYDSLIFESEDTDPNGMKKLVVPHERLHEREFVLRPLADMIPRFLHPRLKLPIYTLLEILEASKTSDKVPLKKVIPFIRPSLLQSTSQPTSESRYWTWGSQTHIMSVVNTTPDSFSDGGDHTTVQDAMDFVDSFVSPDQTSMVSVIDIGGYSTRPGAANVTPDEEVRRTVPFIQAIRDSPNPTTSSTLISIDTFRASVAQAALDAGADIVNDVYGLAGEGSDNDSLLNVVRTAGCPVILMHSRGDAGQDKDYVHGVIPGIRDELGAKVQRALKGGVRRWNIIADPGIGFSKTVEDNLTTIRHLGSVTAPDNSARTGGVRSLALCIHQIHPLTGLPILTGASRKSFLGQVIDREATPKERLAATIAAHTAAIQQGADIIRVHDVLEAWDTVKLADGLWR